MLLSEASYVRLWTAQFSSRSCWRPDDVSPSDDDVTFRMSVYVKQSFREMLPLMPFLTGSLSESTGTVRWMRCSTSLSDGIKWWSVSLSDGWMEDPEESLSLEGSTSSISVDNTEDDKSTERPVSVSAKEFCQHNKSANNNHVVIIITRRLSW